MKRSSCVLNSGAQSVKPVLRTMEQEMITCQSTATEPDGLANTMLMSDVCIRFA